MRFSRRDFLKTGSVALGAMIVPQVLLRARPASAAGSDPVLVSLFLRGGADGLNLVVPHGDPGYYAVRPTIRVAPGSELDLDGFFGFHPALAPLLPLYQSGQLAAIHACGSPHDTRSHFDAQDFMEFGVPGDKSVREGWLNRFLVAAGMSDPLSAVTIGNSVAKSLAGPSPSLALATITDLNFSGTTTWRRPAIEAMYATSGNPQISWLPSSTFATSDVLQTVSTATSVNYPSSKLGAALKDLAALIKADIGVRLGAVDLGGWDHHFNESTEFPAVAGVLAAALAAFAQDLGPDLNRTVVLVMSEFGRRVAENGSLGCDHGHGGVMLALGGGIAGGRVLVDGGWPGLEPGNLFEGIDVPVTTDFRDVFGELLTRHMGLADAGGVFPGYPLDPARYPGLFV
jgi:uncharacterized protein (DUF1501 family)